METGLFHDYLAIFPHEMKDITFMRDEIEPMRGEIETNIEKLKFPFWVEGTFGDDIWWGGGRRSRLGWG